MIIMTTIKIRNCTFAKAILRKKKPPETKLKLISDPPLRGTTPLRAFTNLHDPGVAGLPGEFQNAHAHGATSHASKIRPVVEEQVDEGHPPRAIPDSPEQRRLVQCCVAVLGIRRFGEGAFREEEEHEWHVVFPGGPAEGQDRALARLQGKGVEARS
ncbi:unnamed protein product [Tuber aestivum]|uniref:Uncharacterized protein n=1 Tax=Tuber aestivum TaxID=59557 RepID=A0A292Q0P6_9PEZI|nr:unnamed protein product [Tuber aestivum]